MDPSKSLPNCSAFKNYEWDILFIDNVFDVLILLFVFASS